MSDFSILNNKIILFYKFENEYNLDHLNFKALQGIGVPQEILEKCQERSNHGDFTLWKEVPIPVSTDFIPAIQSVFSSNIQKHSIDNIILSLFSGQKIRNLELPNKLKFEVKTVQSDSISLLLNDLSVYTFKDSNPIAALELEITKSNLSCAELQKALDKLSRFNEIFWSGNLTGTKTNKKLSLGAIVRTILNSPIGTSYSRVFSLTYADTKEVLSDAQKKECLTKLARQFTSDYKITKSVLGTKYIEEFQNLASCYSNDGSAALVHLDDASPAFLKTFKENSFANVYFPIHLLVLQQQFSLNDFNVNIFESSSFKFLDDIVDNENKNHRKKTINSTLDKLANQIGSITRIKEDLDKLEYLYFYPQISNITGHNHIYNALQELKAIKTLQQKNLASANTLMTQLDSQKYFKQQLIDFKKNRITLILSALGIGAATTITAATILGDIKKAIWKPFAEMSGQIVNSETTQVIATSWIDIISSKEAIVLFISLFLGATAAFLTYRMNKNNVVDLEHLLHVSHQAYEIQHIAKHKSH